MNARVMRGEARRVIAVDRVERRVGRARCQIVEDAADPGKRSAAALQGLDRVREIGRLGGGGDHRDLGLVLGHRMVEGRREMLRPDAVEGRQTERRIPGLQKRVVGNSRTRRLQSFR